MVICCLLCMCWPGPCILGDLYVKYIILIYDLLSKKMYMTMSSTSNRWNSSQRFLRICFQGYNSQFSWNKIPFLFLTWQLIEFLSTPTSHLNSQSRPLSVSQLSNNQWLSTGLPQYFSTGGHTTVSFNWGVRYLLDMTKIQFRVNK